MNKFKNFWTKVWEGIKSFWLKVWNYIKYIFAHPRDVLLPTLLAEIVFWIPVWVPALLALTISPWWWTAVTAVIAFWAGPFTPAIALQIGLIAAFERLWNKIIKKKIKNKKENKKDE